MTRRYNPTRARAHLSYTRQELADLFSVGLGTISAWKRKGLQPIEDVRPYLFAGADVRAFLQSHNQPFHPTGPGELYCVACKCGFTPAGDVVDYVPINSAGGNLMGTCPGCSRRVPQRVRKADIGHKAGHLTVQYEDAAATLVGTGDPSHIEPSQEN